MLGKLVILLLLVPALELYLLVLIGREIGVLPTLAMLFATAMLGMSLARAGGLRFFRTFQAALAAGQVPQEGVASGLLVLLGGALLVVPGVLTDVVGVLMLVPFTRQLFVRKLLARMQQAMERGTLHVAQAHVSTYRHQADAANGVIDVEGEVVQSPDDAASARLPENRTRRLPE